MTLTLEIIGPQAAALGAASRKVFDAAGGTIGRLPDNAWALPDPYVSSRHAVIRFRDGTFYIEDTSTNGVFINAPDNQLVKGQPCALKAGDWIFIEPYEIRVSIAAAPAAASPFDDLFSPVPVSPPGAASSPLLDDPFGDRHTPGGVSAPPSPYAGQPPRRATPPPQPYEGFEPLPAEDVDPLHLLGFGPQPAPRQSPRAADLAGGSLLSEHYTPPQPAPAPPAPALPAQGALIPDDYNPLGAETSAAQSLPRVPATPEPPPRRVTPPPPAPAAVGQGRMTPASHNLPPDAPVGGGQGDLASMLAGAGLDNVAVTPELARSFGRILRVVVGGLMDVLQARQRIKSEFRMGMTTFKPADNNPLKFSANVDDALHNLLVKRNAAYLGPVEAFEDAFDDVRYHQVAMLAGVRVAFEAMLAEFEPDRLQEEFDRQSKKGALLAAPAKLRYWDLYREKFHDMVRDPEASFRELFGDEFAKAYEEQLRRLRSQSRAVKS